MGKYLFYDKNCIDSLLCQYIFKKFSKENVNCIVYENNDFNLSFLTSPGLVIFIDAYPTVEQITSNPETDFWIFSYELKMEYTHFLNTKIFVPQTLSTMKLSTVFLHTLQLDDLLPIDNEFKNILNIWDKFNVHNISNRSYNELFIISLFAETIEDNNYPIDYNSKMANALNIVYTKKAHNLLLSPVTEYLFIEELPVIPEPPVEGGEEPPVDEPIEPPVEGGEEPPVEGGEEPPVDEPIEPPVEGGEEAPVDEPIEPPVLLKGYLKRIYLKSKFDLINLDSLITRNCSLNDIMFQEENTNFIIYYFIDEDNMVNVSIKPSALVLSIKPIKSQTALVSYIGIYNYTNISIFVKKTYNIDPIDFVNHYNNGLITFKIPIFDFYGTSN